MKLYVVIVSDVYRGFNDPIYASQNKDKAIAEAIKFINDTDFLNKSDLIDDLLEWDMVENLIEISELNYEME